MKWNCYINRNKEGGIETTKEVLDLPNTTSADVRSATLEASKKFNVDEDRVLCLPTCTYNCTETSHTYDCNHRCEYTKPFITKR